MVKQSLRFCLLLLICLAAGWACVFDGTIRAYLSENFWMPFARFPGYFEKKNVRSIVEPFAGMAEAEGDTPLAKLRAAYHPIAQPQVIQFDAAALKHLMSIKSVVADHGTRADRIAWNNAHRALTGRTAGDAYSKVATRKKPEALRYNEDNVLVMDSDRVKALGDDFAAITKKFHRKNPGEAAAAIAAGKEK